MHALTIPWRQTLRALLRQPGYFAAAVITLALGIGSVTAVFSVVNGVLLKPLPYPDAERIVRINRDQPPFSGPISQMLLADWQAASGDTFAALGAFTSATINLTGSGDAERLSAQRVTPEFWPVMGLEPLLGRYWGPLEESSNERVVVLAHNFWQRRFGADPEVIGRTLTLNGDPYRVVGVTAATFRYPSSTQIYVPTHLPASGGDRGTNFLFVIGRLAAGAVQSQADAMLQTVNSRAASEHPEHAGLGARITPLPTLLNSQVRQPLLIMLAASALVLLIACANLANLLLARASQREHELALRAALGAGRSQLMASVLGEAVIIALLGSVLGVALAAAGVPLLLHTAPDALPGHASAHIDAMVLLVSLCLSLLTLALFGAWPALRAAAAPPARALQDEARGGSGGHRQSRTRSALVVAEVALSMTLLTGAGLMIESLRQLARVDTGVNTAGVLTAAIVLPLPEVQWHEDFVDNYRKHTLALGARLDPIIEHLQAVPGVLAVGVSDALPLSGMDNISSGVSIVGRPTPDSGEQPGANWRFINPDFVDALGMRVVTGRLLNHQDYRPGDMPGTVMVNETFARRHLDGLDPLGEQVDFLGGPKAIVGVLADVSTHSADSHTRAEVYMLHGHSLHHQFHLALRVQGDPMSYAEPLRQALRELEPQMPVFDVQSMDQLAAGSSRLRRFNLHLMAVFASLALLMAALGLYGVMSYNVAQRRQEIGVRMSLGASPSEILNWVLGQGMRMVLAGLVLGTAGALLFGRAISTQLYGVGSADLWVLSSVLLTLLGVAALACLLPAHRATRVAPGLALRSS